MARSTPCHRRVAPALSISTLDRYGDTFLAVRRTNTHMPDPSYPFPPRIYIYINMHTFVQTDSDSGRVLRSLEGSCAMRLVDSQRHRTAKGWQQRAACSLQHEGERGEKSRSNCMRSEKKREKKAKGGGRGEKRNSQAPALPFGPSIQRPPFRG